MQNNDKIFKVTAENGVPFTVRRVDFGDKYGLDNCKTHNEQEPLIEFYDARYPHTEWGQFVTRYYQTSLTSKEKGYGLNLDGGIDEWSMDEKSLNAALDAVALIGSGNKTQTITEGRMFDTLFFDNDQKTNAFLEGFEGKAFGVIHSDERGAFVARNNDKGVAVTQPQPLTHTFSKTEDGRLLHVIQTTNTAEARAAMAGPEMLEVLEGMGRAFKRLVEKYTPDSPDAEWVGYWHEAITKAKGTQGQPDFTAQHAAMKNKKPTGGMKP